MEKTATLVRYVPLDWIWTELFIGLMILCGVLFYRRVPRASRPAGTASCRKRAVLDSERHR